MMKLWRNYITSGISPSADPTFLRKVMFVNSFSIVGLSSLFSFSIIHLVLGPVSMGVAQLIFFAIGLSNVILLRKTRNVDFASFTILFFMIGVLVMLFIDGGIQNTGYLWYYTYPMLAFFLKGKKAGFVWIIFLYLFTVLALVLELLEILPFKSYSLFQMNILFASLFAVSLLAYFYEGVKDENIKLMEKSHQEAVDRQRLESQFGIAERIQRSLIPHHSLVFPSVEICGYNQSAHGVGGDYFDFFQIDRERIGMIVSDVAGHGIPAALSMVNIRAIFKSLVRQKKSFPSQIIERMNEILVEDFTDEAFASVFYLEYNHTNRECVFCTAGHGPLVHYSYQQQLLEELASVKGLPVGVTVEKTMYHDQRLILGSGDLLLLFTDGIPEALNKQQQEYGKERLYDLVRQHNAVSAEALKEIVIEDLRRFIGQNPLRDDTTFIIAKVLV